MTRFIAGTDLVEPGLVRVADWRPARPAPARRPWGRRSAASAEAALDGGTRSAPFVLKIFYDKRGGVFAQVTPYRRAPEALLPVLAAWFRR